MPGKFLHTVTMPKMMPEYKEEVRKKIVAVGFEVMCEKGFSQTTMDDIAGRLGVSKPALYRYFKNKEDLVVESSKNFSNIFTEKARTLSPSSDPLEIWNALFDVYMDFDEKVFALYFELLAMTERNPKLREWASENLQRGIEQSKQRAKRNIELGSIAAEADPNAIALASTSIFLGMRGLVLLGVDREEIRERWNTIGRMVYGLA